MQRLRLIHTVPRGGGVKKNFAVGRVHPVEDFPDFSLQEWIQIFDKAARESMD
jgi:hypothetical protein